MDTLAKLMSTYERSHTKDITKLTHVFGVPCILLSVQILLSWIHLPILNLSFAWLALLLLVIYYLFLDLPLAIMTAIFLILITWIAQWIAQDHFNWISFSIFIFLFVIGWISQFAGHHYEGKRPAFMTNFFQLFVAPIFLVAELFFLLGYRKELQKKVLELAQH